ncbi:hypothetical protein LQK93_03983 [Terrabacter sp. BE26]
MLEQAHLWVGPDGAVRRVRDLGTPEARALADYPRVNCDLMYAVVLRREVGVRVVMLTTHPAGGPVVPLRPSAGMGAKRGRGRGSFIDSVLGATDTFYADVLQSLKAWSAAPPKLRQAGPTPPDAEETEPHSLSSTYYYSQDGAEREPATEGPTAPPAAADAGASSA